MPDSTYLRVLIVDDERVVADTLAVIVGGRGHTARAAYDGASAAAIADEFEPHAVICDVIMPGMDGIELANWLEDHHPQCRILLISGQVSTVLFERAALQGRGRTVLPKPVYPSEIFKFLANITPAAEPSEA